MRIYKGIGIMSGTSLDGMDIAYCKFYEENNKWRYKILYAETIPYTIFWSEKLATAETKSAMELAQINVDFGLLTAEYINSFIKKHNIAPEFIASHGHTIFHQPEKSLTLQIGSGAHIATKTNTLTIYDFRSVDVAKGGQGAPLVPIGDMLLFPEYDICLNIGGIANISFQNNNKRVAFDICPANMALNYLASLKKLKYDDKGASAKQGEIDNTLLEKLNSFDFYHQKGAKSLGKEWFIKNIKPLLDNTSLNINNKLCTFVEHIAIQISLATDNIGNSMLISGGGTYNNYLIERIKHHTNYEITIPQQKIIDYKEALVFAFLGVLRLRNQVNTLQSVTGATSDSVSGIIV
ncbi:MAG: anhydro-N-acetylmuramic acid kinase [Bacteroidota bacterium]|nr:anhydro-N-acetylmuramic acid kinase [Bacteroidota bacterium]